MNLREKYLVLIENGVSQTVIARKMGIPTSTFYMWLAGERNLPEKYKLTAIQFIEKYLETMKTIM